MAGRYVFTPARRAALKKAAAKSAAKRRKNRANRKAYRSANRAAARQINRDFARGKYTKPGVKGLGMPWPVGPESAHRPHTTGPKTTTRSNTKAKSVVVIGT